MVQSTQFHRLFIDFLFEFQLLLFVFYPCSWYHQFCNKHILNVTCLIFDVPVQDTPTGYYIGHSHWYPAFLQGHRYDPFQQDRHRTSNKNFHRHHNSTRCHFFDRNAPSLTHTPFDRGKFSPVAHSSPTLIMPPKPRVLPNKGGGGQRDTGRARSNGNKSSPIKEAGSSSASKNGADVTPSRRQSRRGKPRSPKISENDQDLSVIMPDPLDESVLLDNTFDASKDLSTMLEPPLLHDTTAAIMEMDPQEGHKLPVEHTSPPAANFPMDTSGTVTPSAASHTKSVNFRPGTAYAPTSPQVLTTPTDSCLSDRQFLFCSVKEVTLPERSLSALSARLTLILKGLVDLKIGFQLHGYDPSENMPSITKLDSIGTKITQFRRYFYGLYLAKVSWSQWRISWLPPHTDYTTSHFLADANATLSEFDTSMFAKWLQEPFTATAGWIFKSLEHTDLSVFHDFLVKELRENHNFSGPIALYRKVPFTGNAAGPAKPVGYDTRSLGRAIHVDTIEYLSTTLWQKLNRLLKSPAMKGIHNFEWKFIPQFHSRRSATDQSNLREAAAKQKLVNKAITTVSCDFFLDIDTPFNDQGITIRRYFLDQRNNQTGSPLVLAIDRSETGTDHIFTSAKEFAESLSEMVHFSPISLQRIFGVDIKRKLSIYGIAALEDQYWDEERNLPRSKFSDCIREDHMDDRDIRIVF